MRDRQRRCVVTFPTTAAAMALEARAQTAGLPGRLIPVPRVITAGCGLCWSAPPEAREALESLAVAERLQVDGFYDILL